MVALQDRGEQAVICISTRLAEVADKVTPVSLWLVVSVSLSLVMALVTFRWRWSVLAMLPIAFGWFWIGASDLLHPDNISVAVIHELGMGYVYEMTAISCLPIVAVFVGLCVSKRSSGVTHLESNH